MAELTMQRLVLWREEDYARVRAAAEGLGLSVGAFIRCATLNAVDELGREAPKAPTEVQLEKGWLMRDVAAASARLAEWSKPRA